MNSEKLLDMKYLTVKLKHNGTISAGTCAYMELKNQVHLTEKRGQSEFSVLWATYFL